MLSILYLFSIQKIFSKSDNKILRALNQRKLLKNILYNIFYSIYFDYNIIF